MTDASPTRPQQSADDAEVVGPRRYRNGSKLFRNADPAWQAAADAGLIGVRVDSPDGNNRLLEAGNGHEFVNMCSIAYLGLNTHPKVIDGAIQALREAGNIQLVISSTRIRHRLLARLEEDLGDLFGAFILPAASCSALTAGILPLLAAGLPGDEPRVMVFDRGCHFSMAHVKPICADESLVLTCPPNDIDYLEDVCRRYPRVVYVVDGAHSMGGSAALNGMRYLQDKYGLFLYLDDSHSLSIHGSRGAGIVRSRLEPNELTIIVASLAKGFGTGGGIAMLGSPALVETLRRHAGPVGWSQNMTIPVIGASLASAAIHRSDELATLQARLQQNIAVFDQAFPTPLAGNGLPVRRVVVGEADRAVRLSAELYRRGFYSSAVFFPIVPLGEAGLRIMLRADLSAEKLDAFIGHVQDVTAAV